MYELSRRSLVKLGAGLVALGATGAGEAVAQAVGSKTELSEAQRATYAALIVAVADVARDGHSTLTTDEAVARFASWYSSGTAESCAAVDQTLAELDSRTFAGDTRGARASKLRTWRRAPCCSNQPGRTRETVRSATLASDAIGLAAVPYAEPDGKPVPAF